MSAEGIIVRPMTEADLDAIREIQQSSVGAAAWNPSDYLSHRAWVAEIEGSVAGFAVLRELVPGEVELLNLAVAPEARRKGVGKALLASFCGRGDDVYLEVRESNEIAQRLYRRAGFRLIGRRAGYYSSPPEDAIVMVLQKC